MDTAVWAALGGALVGAIGATTAQMVKAVYDRNGERRSVAAALRGELMAYDEAYLILAKQLPVLEFMSKELLPSNGLIPFPQTDTPTDRIFPAVVAKIGLLPPDVASDIAYVYNMITAFRTAFILAGKAVDARQQLASIQNAIVWSKKASERGYALLSKLEQEAKRRRFGVL